jgi:hypothetical protein
MPMDGSEWSEDLRYLGMPERNLESAVLRALGLRCRRANCGKCQTEQGRHGPHDPSIESFVEGGAGYGVRRKLTYDMIPGSYLSKESILDRKTSVEQLARWLACRGRSSSGNKESLKQVCLNALELEMADPGNVNLVCPDARSLIEYLIKSRQVTDIPEQYDQDLCMAVKASPNWLTKTPRKCTRALRYAHSPPFSSSPPPLNNMFFLFFLKSQSPPRSDRKLT